ncbi:MAG: hypothetical protein WAK62_12165 [Terriglobales bacterium]
MKDQVYAVIDVRQLERIHAAAIPAKCPDAQTARRLYLAKKSRGIFAFVPDQCGRAV